MTVDGTEIPLSCSITAERNTDAYASDRVDREIVLADHGVDAQTAVGSVTFHVTVYMAPRFSADGMISGYSDAVEFDFPTELS